MELNWCEERVEGGRKDGREEEKSYSLSMPGGFLCTVGAAALGNCIREPDRGPMLRLHKNLGNRRL